MSPLTRRDFLKLVNNLLAVTGAAAIVAPIVAYFYPSNLQETPSEPVRVSTLDELPAGESKTIGYGRYPALVVNTPEGIRAFSAVCTHFACIVKWDAASGLIYCPCHDGYFDPQDGHVVSGPPPIALTPIPVNVVDNEIFIGGAS
ncbi:MAG: ubiquinol-cytochrome c reductase iron-sulfur subunit [Acidobacteriaceae bacterium]